MASMISSDPLAELITNYFELNSEQVEKIDDTDSFEEVDDPDQNTRGVALQPSALEFMRFVARNTPFIAPGAAAGWPAVRRWTVDFLKETLANTRVNVAVTPNGYADAPTRGVPGDREMVVFARPWEEDQSFPDFLDYVSSQGKGNLPPGAEIRYAQTQNDNLRDEYVDLLPYVEMDIAFARIAMRQTPEAINLWIGNDQSVTALHRDNYENVYVQIVGEKHFILLPPLCQPCVNEKTLDTWTYQRVTGGSGITMAPTYAQDKDGNLTNDVARVPFPIWDPEHPTMNTTEYSHLAKPVHVTLKPGDMLYLPAMWYHKVSQSCSKEGICISVNYWYDMEFTGPLYPMTSFVRSVYQNRQNAGQQNATRESDPHPQRQEELDTEDPGSKQSIERRF